MVLGPTAPPTAATGPPPRLRPVDRLAARIGRNSLLLHTWLLDRIETIDEPVVLDPFETFVYSRDDRLGIAAFIGRRWWFAHGIDATPHRRTRRRSADVELPRRICETVVSWVDPGAHSRMRVDRREWITPAVGGNGLRDLRHALRRGPRAQGVPRKTGRALQADTTCNDLPTALG